MAKKVTKKLVQGKPLFASIKEQVSKTFTCRNGLHIIYGPGLYARPFNNEYRVGMIGCPPTNELVIPAEDVELFQLWMGIKE